MAQTYLRGIGTVDWRRCFAGDAAWVPASRLEGGIFVIQLCLNSSFRVGRGGCSSGAGVWLTAMRLDGEAVRVDMRFSWGFR